MGMPFNADEVFEMAEQIERNGIRFYRIAAKKFPKLNDLFLDLAEMEVEHEKTFARMRKELTGTEAEPLVFDPDNEAQMYLRVMAGDHVFDPNADPAEQFAGIETVEDVITKAIGLEKDSITFYVGIKESVSQRAGKDKVDAIIKEEVGHIAVLKEKLDGLQ
jgi:rubrerythrin